MRKKHENVEVVSSGSSLKLCLVAEGRADIYPRLGPTMEWDTAAGQAIVEQANGSVLNYKTGEPLQYNKKNLLNSWFIVKTQKDS
jgi:3'(2'), 5'-bisphosphate nucleotidase